MKIYFSGRVFEPTRSGGIIGYFLGLVQAFGRRATGRDEVHAGFSLHGWEELGRQLPPEVHRHALVGLDGHVQAANERMLIEQLRPDWVIYCVADPMNHYGDGREFRTACCIADLQHLHYPYFFTPGDRLIRDAAFAQAAGSADLVFTLSDFCRRDLRETYGLPAGRVEVIYPAAADAFLQGPAAEVDILRTRKKFVLPANYSIYPGNFWAHKNHARLLGAWRRLVRGPRLVNGAARPHLVLVGNPVQASDEVRARLRESEREGWLSRLGYVDDTDLHALVSGARCVTFPSLFEGFGIPVAEALAVGRPVACADACSLPEVGADLAHYFDALDEADIARAVRAAWEQPVDESFRERARAQAHRFTYQEQAERLRAALVEFAGEPAPRVPADVRLGEEPPLVSIVTPSFQHAPFLRACIDSVLTQDYPRIEYAVHDGGSTDGTVDILRSYGDRFPWRSAPDGGQTQAINAGLREAKGEILAYLNSDDFLLPGAVSAVVAEWRQRPSVDVLYGRAHWADEAGDFTAEYAGGPLDPEVFRGRCIICQPATFWRRRTMERFGWFDERFRFGMDYEYWQRVHVGGGAICFLDRFLAASREHANTKTRSQRGGVFRDVLAGQWRHWGRVHHDWWLGLIYYLADERGGPWRRALPADPVARAALAQRLARLLAKPGAPGAAIPALRNLLRTRRPEGAFASAPNPRHGGIYSDGWVLPEAWIEAAPRGEARAHLVGMSPTDNTLRLLVDDQEVHAEPLAAGQRFRMDWTLPAGHHRVTFRAAGAPLSAEDAREAAFVIYSTNLLLL